MLIFRIKRQSLHLWSEVKCYRENLKGTCNLATVSATHVQIKKSILIKLLPTCNSRRGFSIFSEINMFSHNYYIKCVEFKFRHNWLQTTTEYLKDYWRTYETCRRFHKYWSEVSQGFLFPDTTVLSGGRREACRDDEPFSFCVVNVCITPR